MCAHPGRPMSERPIVYVVPRWGGTTSSDWYPWLAREASRELGVDVRRVEMPSPDVPVIGNWLFTLERVASQARLEEAIFIGHSVGCQAVVRYLARQPEGARAKGCLLVAAWWDVDEPWETLKPWTTTPFDAARAKSVAGRTSVLLSTNDPFTKDYEENARLWRERMDADVRVLENKAHYNGAAERDVLEALAALL